MKVDDLSKPSGFHFKVLKITVVFKIKLSLRLESDGFEMSSTSANFRHQLFLKKNPVIFEYRHIALKAACSKSVPCLFKFKPCLRTCCTREGITWSVTDMIGCFARVCFFSLFVSSQRCYFEKRKPQTSYQNF